VAKHPDWEGWTVSIRHKKTGHVIETGVGSNAGKFLLFNSEGYIVSARKRLSDLMRHARKIVSGDTGT